MICPKCGKEINDDVFFCNYCGFNIKNVNPINSQINGIQNNIQTEPSPNINSGSISNKKINTKMFIIIGICLLVVLILFFVILKKKDSSSNIGANYSPSKFSMIIDEVKSAGDGVTIYGKIKDYNFHLGEKVQLITKKHKVVTCTISDINVEEHNYNGDYMALTLTGVKKEDVIIGEILTSNNAFKESKEFLADVYILTRDEGGRNTPFEEDYKPQVNFGFDNINSTIVFADGSEMAFPGDNHSFKFTIKESEYMAVGSEFKIYNDGRVEGRGIVKEIY